MAKVRRSGGDPVVVSRGPEFTRVDDETERKIPLRTWVTCIAVSMVDVCAFVAILVLLSRQVYHWRHPMRAYGGGWWARVSRALSMWSPTVFILMLSSVILWSAPLLYRFLVETVTKHPPQYTPYPSEYGMWRPWRRPAPDDDGEEMEKAAKPPTVDLNLWEMVQGKKRMRQVLDLMLDTRARQFYRALAGGAASFSEREASRYGIRPGEFRKYIREPLRRKDHAIWKDDNNHKLGLKLTPSAIVMLGHLGRSPAPPQKRA